MPARSGREGDEVVTGPKLNEHPVLRRRPESRAQAITEPTHSAKAVARFVRVSAYKVREVLDMIRGHEIQRATDMLRLCDRDAATVVGKVLASAVANGEANHSLVGDELYVSACFADEGPTLKRWRPRARGRATRIRKRTCHVTVIVSRLPDRDLQRHRAERSQAVTGRRARRGPVGRRRTEPDAPTAATESVVTQPVVEEAAVEQPAVEETVVEETVADEAAGSSEPADSSEGKE